MPTFSVVIPTYNNGKFIRNALLSVSSQIFKDYEIIVIDDGSTDDTENIVKEFNVRYYRIEHSGLPAAARNEGILKARGKYIAFLDSDDIWYPDKLKRVNEVFNDNIDLVYHNEINGNYRNLSKDMFRQLLFEGNCLSPSAVCIRRDKIKFFSEDKRFYSVEDYDLWLTLSKTLRFYSLPVVLGEYVNEGISLNKYHFSNQITVIKKHFMEYKEKRLLDWWLIMVRILKLSIRTILN